ncbi:MAG TPA: metallophosphatase domain-containing protein [Flavobacteriaceae bacterium]|nr:metallophosphatase domain-containing protein [Flavobacteriaceae bacterium]
MEIICISDTHNNHQKLLVPNGDVLVHAGDVTERGTEREVRDFLKWFSDQPHRHKIFIAGNHDFFLEKKSSSQIAKILPENVHYLSETQLELSGVLFWGSPITPGTKNWAFSERRFYRWKNIPPNTDILITHTPPYGILDVSNTKKALGSKALLKRILSLKPKYHIFGHMHENYGKVKRRETVFVNASTFNQNEKLVNPPIKIIV